MKFNQILLQDRRYYLTHQKLAKSFRGNNFLSLVDPSLLNVIGVRFQLIPWL